MTSGWWSRANVPGNTGAPTRRRRQHACGDKGYDFLYPDVRKFLRTQGYEVHIPRRSEKLALRRRLLGCRARGWVVERTHSWMNRWRRLLVRWENKDCNYEGFLELTCGFIVLHMAGVMG